MSTDNTDPTHGSGSDPDAAFDAHLAAAGKQWRADQPPAAMPNPAMFRQAPTRSGWLVAAAAASVVLIAGGVFVAAGTGGSGSSGGSGVTPAADGTAPPTRSEEPSPEQAPPAYSSSCVLEFVPESGSTAPPKVVECPSGIAEPGSAASGEGVFGAPGIPVDCEIVLSDAGPAPSAATEVRPPVVTLAPSSAPPTTGDADPSEPPGAGAASRCVVILAPGGEPACVIRVSVGGTGPVEESGWVAYPPLTAEPGVVPGGEPSGESTVSVAPGAGSALDEQLLEAGCPASGAVELTEAPTAAPSAPPTTVAPTAPPTADAPTAPYTSDAPTETSGR